MAHVYRAFDERSKQQVALKQAFFTEDDQRHWFENEAKNLQKLNHPSLPKFIDYFVESRGHFLVMEYVPGIDLAELLACAGPIHPCMVLPWAKQLLGVLTYLHSQNPPIVHRDIKPKNIKLIEGKVVLLDFGISKSGDITLVDAESSGYSSPEQAFAWLTEERHTDNRSDVYSLGATIYHLLSGIAPADAKRRYGASQHNQEYDAVKPLYQMCPEVSAELSSIVHKAMALEPDYRFSTAIEMLDALDTVLMNFPSNHPIDPLEAKTPIQFAALKSNPAFSNESEVMLSVLGSGDGIGLLSDGFRVLLKSTGRGEFVSGVVDIMAQGPGARETAFRRLGSEEEVFIGGMRSVPIDGWDDFAVSFHGELDVEVYHRATKQRELIHLVDSEAVASYKSGDSVGVLTPGQTASKPLRTVGIKLDHRPKGFRELGRDEAAARKLGRDIWQLAGLQNHDPEEITFQVLNEDHSWSEVRVRQTRRETLLFFSRKNMPVVIKFNATPHSQEVCILSSKAIIGRPPSESDQTMVPSNSFMRIDGVLSLLYEVGRIGT